MYPHGSSIQRINISSIHQDGGLKHLGNKLWPRQPQAFGTLSVLVKGGPDQVCMSLLCCDYRKHLHHAGHPSSHLAQTEQFTTPEGQWGQERHGQNVSRMLVNVACLALTRKTEAHGDAMLDVAWCQPHRMGHGQHPNLKMDTDGWIYSNGCKWISLLWIFWSHIICY